MDRSDLKNASDAIGDALDLMTDLIDILDLRAKADADEISQAVVDLVKERGRLAEQVVMRDYYQLKQVFSKRPDQIDPAELADHLWDIAALLVDHDEAADREEALKDELADCRLDLDEARENLDTLKKKLNVVTAERDDAKKARDALLLRVDELIADLGDL